MTGSGKTTLARYLLQGRLRNSQTRKYKVVADYKGKIDWPEYERHTSLKSLVKSKTPSLLYRPTYGESQDTETIAAFWEWIYRRGGTTVYVDETTAITNGNTYPYHYGGCFVRGRELGIEVWSATQRPKDIPQIVLSESEHSYCFRLRLDQDRERVEQTTGISRDAIASLEKQYFLYARLDGNVQGPLHLSI
jgi:DNA helicase HerA-like ATPase